MSKKHRYSSQDVEKFEVASVVALLVAGCIVAVDVAKTKFYAGIANLAGDVVRIVRFEHPKQTRSFLGVLEALSKGGSAPRVVMEPTGSYGDALRYQCHAMGVPVFMSSPKHTHDMAEVLDGVPSMHDAKAVVVLAKLHAIQPGRQWQPERAERRDLRTVVDRHAMYAETRERLFGRLEGLLARSWPELDGLLDLRSRRSWMPLLSEFPGPAMVAANSEKASEILRKASRSRIASDEIATVVMSAKESLGVPMTQGDVQQLRELVAEIHRITREMDRVDKEMATILARQECPATRTMKRTIGLAATATTLAYVGSPADYDSAAAFEKAAGLNVKIRSSGKYSGQLKITKRGPSRVRHLLHMASLRLIQDDAATRAWYQARDSFKAGTKLKAVTAVTRKLIRAVWHIGRTGEAFDSSKLFDTRRLKLPEGPVERPTERMKKRRSSAVANATRLAAKDAAA